MTSLVLKITSAFRNARNIPHLVARANEGTDQESNPPPLGHRQLRRASRFLPLIVGVRGGRGTQLEMGAESRFQLLEEYSALFEKVTAET